MVLNPVCEHFAQYLGIELMTLLPSTIRYYGDLHSSKAGDYSIFYAPGGTLGTPLAGNGMYDELLRIVLGETSEFSTTRHRNSIDSKVTIRGYWIADYLAQLDRVENEFSKKLRDSFRRYPKENRFDRDRDYSSTFNGLRANDLLRVLTCVYSPLNPKSTP